MSQFYLHIIAIICSFRNYISNFCNLAFSLPSSENHFTCFKLFLHFYIVFILVLK